MRLLNTTSLEVEEFPQSEVPEYVILSHTWTRKKLRYKTFDRELVFPKKDTTRSLAVAERVLMMVMPTAGPTRVASTKLRVQNFLKPLTLCIAGTRMHTSDTFILQTLSAIHMISWRG